MTASVRVFDSADDTGRALARDLDGAHRVSIAVAFAKPSAWQAVDLRAWCGPERSLRLVVGTDFEITDLDVLRDLGSQPNAECKVMHRATGPPLIFTADPPVDFKFSIGEPCADAAILVAGLALMVGAGCGHARTSTRRVRDRPVARPTSAAPNVRLSPLRAMTSVP